VSGVHCQRGGDGAGDRSFGRRSVLRGLGGTGARPIRLAGLLAVAIVSLFALTASPALAALAHQYESRITEAGGAPLGTPQGLAVDSTGNLYVADGADHALDKFDPAGSPLTAWGTNGQITEAPAGTPLSNPSGLAVDGADNLWIADAGLSVVDKLGPSGTFLRQSAAEGHLSSFILSLGFSTASDHLFVADSNEDGLHVLDPEGAFIETLAGPWGSGQFYVRTAAGTTGGDVYVSNNGGGIYRIDGATGAEAPFSESASYIEGAELTGTPEGPFGQAPSPQGALQLAVDSAGDLYVGDSVKGRVDEFAPSGKYLGKVTGTATGPSGAIVPFGEVSGVGVNASTGKLYVADQANHAVDVFGPAVVVPDVTTTPPMAVTTTLATLDGEVNPAGLAVEECLFEYGENEAYGQTAPCEDPDAAGLGTGNATLPVHAAITGLHPGATYHYRLAATNANGTNKESGDQSFFTGATILSTSVSGVSATAATLETEIDPNGIATSYHFEYDTVPYGEGEGPHGQSTPMPPTPLGAGSAPIARQAQIGGLMPLTTYHFRAVAESALGTVYGPERAFTTQGAAASVLPDGRVWEMVSPPDKHGVPLEALTEEGGIIQAAQNGDGLAYIARGPITSETAGNRSAWETQLLAHRHPSGWSTQEIATPHRAAAGALPSYLSEYKLFSSDLSQGAVEPFGSTPLSPQASEDTPYIRQADGEYVPLVTAANVPEGLKFAGEETSFEQYTFAPRFVAATPDLSHVLLASRKPLTPDFTPGFESKEESIFEWTDGSLQLVSWIPPGVFAACGGAGPACAPAAGALKGGASSVGIDSEAGGRNVRHAISTNGSRVVFTTTVTGVGAGKLYLRDLTSDETIELDVPESGATGNEGGAEFQDASADGSRVFFTDLQHLTLDSGGRANPVTTTAEPDLYECQIVTGESGNLECRLTDLTPKSPTGGPADVLGSIVGTSEDGSSVYFVADGDLDGSGPAVAGDCLPQLGSEAGSGTCNLYRYDTATKLTSLVAELSANDYLDWSAKQPKNLGSLTARISPDGRYTAFMSERGLTGYNTHDAKSGRPDEEVYLYDSKGPLGHQLSCVSCNPTGARPHGVFDSGEFPGLLVDRQSRFGWEGHWLAGSIPGWTRASIVESFYQSRYLSDSGRLFFNAADSLVPQDSNGVEDVYEYEPPGVGDCTTSSPTFGQASGGCVSLISSGTSPEESAFLDASENGNDVFFLTASRLSATDVDNALDIYDASVGGHAAEPSTAIECAGDACQQSAVPPNDATPGSLTFNGAGNVLECAKGKVKQKGKCVKKKKAKKNKRKHHKKKGMKQKGKANKRANSKHGGQK
jgi:hypothetical protein